MYHHWPAQLTEQDRADIIALIDDAAAHETTNAGLRTSQRPNHLRHLHAGHSRTSTGNARPRPRTHPHHRARRLIRRHHHGVRHDPNVVLISLGVCRIVCRVGSLCWL
jgi:hypothetical protein